MPLPEPPPIPVPVPATPSVAELRALLQSFRNDDISTLSSLQYVLAVLLDYTYNLPVESGITELTGDVTTGTGGGSQAATVEGIQGNPVSAAAPASGDALVWDGAQWAPTAGGGGGGVSNVTASSPLTSSGGATPDIALTAGATDGDLLTWDALSSAWVVTPAPAASVTSVTASSPLNSSGGATPDISLDAGTTAGDVLTWDGSAWSGSAPATPASPGGVINSVQTNDGAGGFGGDANLTYDGTTLKMTSVPGGSTEFFEVNANTLSVKVYDSVGGNVDSVKLELAKVTVDSSAGAGFATMVLETITDGTPRINSNGGTGPLDLAIGELRVNTVPGAAGEVLTSNGPGVAPTWQAAGGSLSIANEVWVTKNGSDVTGDGSLSKPYASVSFALSAITTATPTSRWAVRVAPGEYTEAGPVALKANVFIIGENRRNTRLTSTGGWTLGASFTPAGDHRSGALDVALSGACNFNFASVTSNEGKLYFESCLFISAVTLNGFSAINQGESLNCNFFGAFTLSGVNWFDTGGIHLSQQIFLNQHASVPTLLAATNGYADKITLTTTVNNFARRCSLFSRSFWTDDLTVDGDVSYADLSSDSVARYGPVVLNNGNIVNISPYSLGVKPDVSSVRSLGDFGSQWFFTFNYVNVSSGTDLYVGTVDSSYDPAGSTAGYSVFVQPDQYGIQANVNGGLLDLRTANATGTGNSGNVAVATGTTVDGNSGNISLTTGSASGTGTRGDLSIDSNNVNVDLAGELSLNGAPGSAGEVLTSNGPGVAPTWQPAGGGSAVSPVTPVPSGGSHTCTAGNELVRVAPTGVGNITVTLPNPSTTTGKTITVKKTTSDVIDTVNIVPSVGNIDGSALAYPLPASAYSVLSFISDGSNYWVI